MAVFLLEHRRVDKERQADFPSKEGSSPILKMTANLRFTDGAIITDI